MSSRDWVKVASVAELAEAKLLTFKHEVCQLAVGQTEEGQLFAIDNRCPHEGYPLAQGKVKGCLLTCAWHNWKFDVGDGKCVLGGENVRTWPIRQRNGQVEVDVTPPDPKAAIPGLLVSLEEALVEGTLGRALRDGVRLLGAGMSPQRLLAELVRLDGLYGEFGTSHVLPMAADAAHLIEADAGVEAMHAIGPVAMLWIESHRHRPLRPQVAGRPGGDRESYLHAVEEERLEDAEAMLKGAFEAGVPEQEILAWLFEATSTHFTDFGHQLIYMIKLQELLNRFETDTRRELLQPIAVGLNTKLVLGTREDTLPYMQAYFRRWQELEDQLSFPPEAASNETAWDADQLRDATLDGTGAQAFEQLQRALLASVSGTSIAEALVKAAAHRLYRFDASIALDPDISEGWIWCTHRLTFAAAARQALERWPSRWALRFLVQSLAFTHSGRKMDAPKEQRPEAWPAASSQGVGSVANVIAAIRASDPVSAHHETKACLAHADNRRSLRAALLELSLDDIFVRPIFTAHALKTLVVAWEEHDSLGADPDRSVPLLATVRWLATPVPERQVQVLVRRAIRWVAEDIMPRKLTQ